MTRLSILISIAAAFTLGATGSAQAQEYSQKQLQEIFSRHLAQESIRSEITGSGGVRFKSQGRTYVMQVDERDPLYFRLTMAFVAEDKGADERQRMLEACNTASSEVKVIKCFLDEEGDPTFAAELFLVVPGDFSIMFDRVLRATDSAYRRYSRRLSEQR